MSLVESLRAALAGRHDAAPELIGGDVLEGEEPGAGPITPAAVLVAIVDRPDPTVILTLRPETMRKHPGQVSFPGGRIDEEGPHDALVSRPTRYSQLYRLQADRFRIEDPA